MDTLTRPVIEKLGRAACVALLERNRVGRIAFADGPRVDVQPVHYVVHDGWIYGRTSEGAKLYALKQNWLVAFEVDEIDDLFEWRSVVVHGGFYRLDPEGTAADVARWETALAELRTVLPETFTDADPVPYRSVLFGIAMQEVSGRAASARRHPQE